MTKTDVDHVTGLKAGLSVHGARHQQLGQPTGGGGCQRRALSINFLTVLPAAANGACCVKEAANV